MKYLDPKHTRIPQLLKHSPFPIWSSSWCPSFWLYTDQGITLRRIVSGLCSPGRITGNCSVLGNILWRNWCLRYSKCSLRQGGQSMECCWLGLKYCKLHFVRFGVLTCFNKFRVGIYLVGWNCRWKDWKKCFKKFGFDL